MRTSLAALGPARFLAAPRSDSAALAWAAALTVCGAAQRLSIFQGRRIGPEVVAHLARAPFRVRLALRCL